jgi:hypothetical protein
MAHERARQVGELLAVEDLDGVVVDCLSHGAHLAAERAVSFLCSLRGDDGQHLDRPSAPEYTKPLRGLSSLRHCSRLAPPSRSRRCIRRCPADGFLTSASLLDRRFQVSGGFVS